MKMMGLEILSDTFLPLHIRPLSTTKAKSEEGGSFSSLTLLTRCQQGAAFTSGGYRTGWVLHWGSTYWATSYPYFCTCWFAVIYFDLFFKNFIYICSYNEACNIWQFYQVIYYHGWVGFDVAVILKHVKEMENGDLNGETEQIWYLSDTCKSGSKTSVPSGFSVLLFLCINFLVVKKYSGLAELDFLDDYFFLDLGF